MRMSGQSSVSDEALTWSLKTPGFFH